MKYSFDESARNPKQLKIMKEMEAKGLDPLDPKVIEQPILFEGKHWYVTENRFPYEGAERHYMIVCKDALYDARELSNRQVKELFDIFSGTGISMMGGALCVRFGEPEYSGASLARVHFHLIKPKEGCKVKFPIGK